MEIVLLVLLGALVLWTVVGLFAGMKRGWKRGLLRVGIFLVFMIIAVFLTPAVSRMVANMGFVQGMFYDIDYADAELISSAIAPIIALPVFLVMYVLFSFLSWIAYAIVQGVIKLDNKGKGLGILVGVAGAFVFFAFFAAPVNGLMGIVNQVDSREPSWASAQSLELDPEQGLDEMLLELRDFNQTIQSSTYGFITRITGMQALGRTITHRLTTTRIEGNSLSMTRDIQGIMEFLIDTRVIINYLDGEDGFDLDKLPEGYLDGWQDSLGDFLNLGFMQIILGDADGHQLIDSFTIAIEGISALFAGDDDEDSDIFQAIADLDDEVIDALADVLGLFTDDWIFSDLVRGFLADMMREMAENEETSQLVVNVLEDLIEDLEGEDPINWGEILRAFRTVFEVVADIADGDTEALINNLLSGEFLNQIAENEFLSRVVVSVVEYAVNEILEGVATINFGDEAQEIIKILGDISSAISNILDGGTSNESEMDDMVDLFGEDPLTTLEDLNETGTTIQVPTDRRAELIAALDRLSSDTARVNAILYSVFGITR